MLPCEILRILYIACTCTEKYIWCNLLQVTVFMSRTFNRRQGLIAGCVVAAVHLLFLLYLHFAYHSVYEGQ